MIHEQLKESSRRCGLMCDFQSKGSVMRNVSKFSLSIMLVCATFVVQAQNESDLVLLSVKKIWDKAPHNAFTGLTYFKGAFYCAFREGDAHAMGTNGKIRVIKSIDLGLSWESVALFALEGGDLRDAKISVSPQGKMALLAANHPEKCVLQSYTYLTEDGTHWEGPFAIGDPGYWLWNTTWYKGTGYNIGYGDATSMDLSKKIEINLYTSSDGKEFDRVASQLTDPETCPNEGMVVFDPGDDKAYCLLRRESPDTNKRNGLLGVSLPPYTNWEWKDIGCIIGGPSLIRLPDGRLLSCIRKYDHCKPFTYGCPQHVELGWVDRYTGKYSPCLTLPSTGDSSYAGMIYNDQDKMLFVSYYTEDAEKEGCTAIYFAKISIPDSEVIQ